MHRGTGKNVHCCVRNCPTNRNRSSYQVHSLPDDRFSRKKWLKALKKASVPASSGVCGRHFTGTLLKYVVKISSNVEGGDGTLCLS